VRRNCTVKIGLNVVKVNITAGELKKETKDNKKGKIRAEKSAKAKQFIIKTPKREKKCLTGIAET